MAEQRRIDYTVGFKTDKSGLDAIKRSLEEIRNVTQQDISKSMGVDTTTAQKNLQAARKEAIAVETAFRKAFNQKLNTVNIDKFNQSLTQSNTNLKQVYENYSKIGAAGQNAFRTLINQMTNSNFQLKETSSLIKEMGTTLMNTVKWNIASSAVNSITGSVQQAYGYVKNLDSSLNDIRIVTGKSADEMTKFAEKANDAAKALKKSTTDYTNASLIFYQQGLGDQEVEARTEVTLKAANVTQQDTAEVSEQLTAIWNGYKVSAEEAELYIDKVAAVAATTAADLEELSTGMSKVASAANLMGVDIDQLNAQLATVVSVTRQAPESVGTAFKTIYARMGDIEAGLDNETTLGNYTQQMADMGFNVLDANNQLRDMGEVIEEIGGKWGTLSREQQVALSQIMAGTRQYNNLLSLFDNWDMYTEALKTSADAAGTLQEQQDIYAESTQAHLQELATSTEGVFDSMLDANMINTVVDALIPLVNGIEQFIDGLGGGIGLLQTFAPLMLKAFGPQIADSVTKTSKNIMAVKENKQTVANMQKSVQSFKETSSSSMDQATSESKDGKRVLKKTTAAKIRAKYGKDNQNIADQKIREYETAVETYNTEKTKKDEEEKAKKSEIEKDSNLSQEEKNQKLAEITKQYIAERQALETNLNNTLSADFTGLTEDFDKQTQSVLNANEALSLLAENMTPEQFESTRKAVESFTSAINNQATATENAEKVNKDFNTLVSGAAEALGEEAGKDLKPLSVKDLLDLSDEEWAKYEENLKQGMQKSLEEVNDLVTSDNFVLKPKNLKEETKHLKTLNTADSALAKIEKARKEGKTLTAKDFTEDEIKAFDIKSTNSLQMINKKIQDAIKNSKEQINKLWMEDDSFQKQVDKIKTVAEQYGIAIGEITNPQEFDEAREKVKEQLEQSGQTVDELGNRIEAARAAMRDSEADATAETEKLYDQLSTDALDQTVQGFTDLTAAMGGVYGAANSVKSVIDIWNDDSLSGVEKAQQLFGALSGTFIGLKTAGSGAVDFLKKISAARVAATQAESLQTAATQANTAANIANAASNAAGATSEAADTAATGANTVTQGANTGALGANSGAKLVNLALTGKLAKMNITEAASHVKAAIAAKLHSLELGKLFAKAAPILGLFLAIAAAAAAWTVAVIRINNAINDGAKTIESYETQMQQLNKNLQQAKQMASDFNSAFDDLKNQKDVLKDLTVGTEEWNNQLTKVKESTESLLEQYPELKQYASYTAEGWQIDETKLQEYQDKLNQNVKNAEISKYNSEISLARANMLDKSDSKTSWWRRIGGDAADVAYSQQQSARQYTTEELEYAKQRISESSIAELKLDSEFMNKFGDLIKDNDNETLKNLQKIIDIQESVLQYDKVVAENSKATIGTQYGDQISSAVSQAFGEDNASNKYIEQAIINSTAQAQQGETERLVQKYSAFGAGQDVNDDYAKEMKKYYEDYYTNLYGSKATLDWGVDGGNFSVTFADESIAKIENTEESLIRDYAGIMAKESLAVTSALEANIAQFTNSEYGETLALAATIADDSTKAANLSASQLADIKKLQSDYPSKLQQVLTLNGLTDDDLAKALNVGEQAREDRLSKTSSQSVEDAARKAFNLTGGEYLTGDQEQQIIDKLEEIYAISGEKGIQDFLTSIQDVNGQKVDVEVALNYEYEAKDDTGLSEEIQKQLEEAKISIDEFNLYKESLLKLNPEEEISDQAVVNTLVSKQAIGNLQKDEKLEQKLKDYQAGNINEANIEALSQTIEALKKATGDDAIDANFIFENLEDVLNYINNKTEDARDKMGELVQKHLQSQATPTASFKELFQDYETVKIGEGLPDSLKQSVTELATQLGLNDAEIRALFEQYGYLQDRNGIYRKINTLQLQIEQDNPDLQIGQEKTETEWKQQLGLDEDADLEELGFIYQFTIPNGPRVFKKTTLLSSEFNINWDTPKTESGITAEELLERYGTSDRETFEKYKWVYDATTGTYSRTITGKEALELETEIQRKGYLADMLKEWSANSFEELKAKLEAEGYTDVNLYQGIVYFKRGAVEETVITGVIDDQTGNIAVSTEQGDYSDNGKTGDKEETPEVDKFRDINAELEKYNTQLERLQKNQEDLTGKDLEENLQKQAELYKKQADAIERKLKLQQQELAAKKKELAGFGVSFDEEGYITNGVDRLSANINNDEEYKKLEKAISEYEDALSNTISLQDDFSDSIRSSANKQYEANLAGINGEIDDSAEALEKAQKEYEKFSKEFEDMTDEEKAASKMSFGDFMIAQIEAVDEHLSNLEEKKKQIEEEAIKLNIGIEFDENGENNIDDIKSEYVKKLDEVNEKLKDQSLDSKTREELIAQSEEYSNIIGQLDTMKDDHKEIQDEIEDSTEKAREYAKAMDISRFIKENTDVYYDVNKEMDGLDRQLSHLQKASKGLEGTALINNLQQQSKIIDQQIKAQKTKIALAKQELKLEQGKLQTKLQNLLADKKITATAVFDEVGMVDNYNDILKAMEKANDLSEEDAKIILGLIEGVNNAAKESISLNEELLDLEYSKEDIQQQIQDVYSSMAEEGQKAAEDAAESMEDELNKRLEWFNMKVDVELDISEATRRLNDLKKRIQGLEDNDILGNAVKNLENLKTYFTGNINSYFGSMDSGAISGLTSHLNAIMGEIGIMQAGGTSSLYGTDQSKAFDDLNNYRDQLMDQLESVEDLKEQIEASYLQMIDKIADKLSDIADDYKQIDSLIQHDMNLIKMVYGENSFDKLALYFDQKVSNDMGALAQARQEQERWKELLDSAEKGSEAWDKYYQNYKNATNNLNSLLESSIQDAMDRYNNLVNKATSDLTKKLSGGYNQDYIDADWEHATMMSDKYLDNINKAYEIQSLRSKMNTSISDTASLKAQQKIRDVMEEQLKILEDKEYVTQYDVDRANKIYDITMKQIALEEAQNNKSQMKLRRDSQGNYRYEYVSDQDDIAQKEQELLEAQNNLYNFDKDRYKEVLQEAEEAFKEYSSKYVEILTSTAYTEEEKAQLIDQLKANYYEAQKGRAVDLGTVEANLLSSANELGEKLLGEGVTSLEEITDLAETSTAELVHNTFGEEGPINTDITNTFDNLRVELENLQNDIKAMAEQAGVDFEQLANGIDPAIEYTKELINDNKDLLASYDEELEAISRVIAELDQLEAAYDRVKQAAIDAVTEALKLREQESLGGDLGGGSGTGSETGDSDGDDDGGNNNNNTPREKGEHGTVRAEVGSDGKLYSSPAIYKNWSKNAQKAADAAGVIHDGFDHYVQGNYWVINGKEIQFKGYKGIEFDTGGYTGNWNSKEGKVAMLHEKELILNKQDTSNILMAVSIVRTLSAKLSNMANNMMNNINSHNAATAIPTQDKTLEQNVKIEASFPNVKNSNDIEQALNNLVNTASMYAMRTKR